MIQLPAPVLSVLQVVSAPPSKPSLESLARCGVAAGIRSTGLLADSSVTRVARATVSLVRRISAPLTRPARSRSIVNRAGPIAPAGMASARTSKMLSEIGHSAKLGPRFESTTR